MALESCQTLQETYVRRTELKKSLQVTELEPWPDLAGRREVAAGSGESSAPGLETAGTGGRQGAAAPAEVAAFVRAGPRRWRCAGRGCGGVVVVATTDGCGDDGRAAAARMLKSACTALAESGRPRLDPSSPRRI
uniref:Uncharacterized protein n=1 Tax=Oryza punctata TaxID=4537 RepID=A0A0E0M3S8_ORYPU